MAKNFAHGNNFERLLLDAIDESLNALGETVKATVLFLLRKNFNLQRREMPHNPRRFELAFRKILGKKGSEVVEDLILKNLYTKLGFKHNEFDGEGFCEHLEKVRRMIENKTISQIWNSKLKYKGNA